MTGGSTKPVGRISCGTGGGEIRSSYGPGVAVVKTI